MRTLKSAKAFERVFKKGRRGRSPFVRVSVLACEGSEQPSVAFVAPKRLGNAVYRNRCKRVLREAARASGLPLLGYDVILFATDRTHSATPEELGRGLRSALAKCGVGALRGDA